MKTIVFLVLLFAFVQSFAQNLYLEEIKQLHTTEMIAVTQNPNLINNYSSTLMHSPLQEGLAVDSAITWTWNRNTENWDIAYRTYYTNYADGNVETSLFSIRMGNEWVNNSLATFGYDAFQNITSILYQRWEEDEWKNIALLLYEYDDHQNLLTEIQQSWDGWAFSGGTRNLYTYDDEDNRLSQTSQYLIDSTWTDGTRNLYTYDEFNREIQELYQANYGGWINLTQFITTYDVNGDADIILEQAWAIDHWQDVDRNLYDWIDHRVISWEIQTFDGVDWTESMRYLNGYDQNENFTSQLFQQFINGEWTNSGQYMAGYDGMFRVYDVTQVWENEWIYADSTHHYYSEISGVADQFQNKDMKIFPNPANELINISFDENSVENYGIEIYSNTGIKLFETKSNPTNSKPVNISHLPPGSYHVVIHHSKGMSIQHFVKL